MTANKENKVPLQLLDFDFLKSMAKQMQAGLTNGREPNDWKRLDPKENLSLYHAAMFRHLAESLKPNARDDTGESHYAAIAVNAMICDWFERRIRARGPRPLQEVLDELGALWGTDTLQTAEGLRELVLKLGALQDLPTFAGGGDDGDLEAP